MFSNILQLSEEVRNSINARVPVVALESTIITHGMPYPQNLETALAVEETVREHDAIPATIGIVAGKIKVGLSRNDLETLGTASRSIKVSRRDLPYAISSGANGGTTVSATMIAARLAGIEVFVTGGIGGVHRQGELSLDISADLTELAQTNVAVVCAGAKAILDIGRTMEYLETLGVPVIGLQTDDFPAFYTRSSGFKADYRIDHIPELARLIRTKWQLGLQGGVLIGNPVPEKDALPEAQMEMAIQAALKAAEEEGIKGKAVTPFLLEYLHRFTDGKSLQTNIALVLHNAEKGAQLAVALSKLN